MASIKLYTVIFGALMVLSTVQYVMELLLVDELYFVAMAAILGVSTVKAIAVSGWYMHAFEEPRAIRLLAISAVIGVLALTAGAAYSIT